MVQKGVNLEGDYVSKIGGKGQFDAIGALIYNEIVKSSWDQILSYDNAYQSRIFGAVAALTMGYDFSGGAYFWNASSPQTGFNWNMYNKGTFEITATVGQTTFFKYSGNKIWP